MGVSEQGEAVGGQEAFSGSLGTGTSVAGGDICLDVGRELWPPIRTLDELEGAGRAEMASRWSIVTGT